jgi:hypothetical protein
VRYATYAMKESRDPATKTAGKVATGGLRIGAPDDAYEREADRVADEIMAGGALKRHWSLSSIGVNAPLRRKCSCGGSGRSEGKCEDCKKKKEEGSQETVQRKSSGTAAPEFAPPIVHEVLNSPGQPLDRSTRDFFERRFGYDFGAVRVHTDRKAVDSAAAVNADGYAFGWNIVLADSRLAPSTKGGLRLLAHELGHVVQQQSGQRLAASIGDAVHAHPELTRQYKPSIARQKTKEEPPTPPTENPDTLPVSKGEARLRNLARRPTLALQNWKSLNGAERSFVIIAMTSRYGLDFAQSFVEFATRKRKPDFTREVIQSDSKTLIKRGFRRAGDPGGIPLWVHPSGREASVLAPGRPATAAGGGEQSEHDRPERSQGEVDRCEQICGDVDDKDECKQCCNENIPESDSPCRANCHQVCENKL